MQIRNVLKKYPVVEELPGFNVLSPECQAEVRASFEAGRVLNPDFKGTADIFGQSDAFVVEYAKSNRAKCNAEGCEEKIPKGGLRMGCFISRDTAKSNSVAFTSWKYFHWCVTLLLSIIDSILTTLLGIV